MSADAPTVRTHNVVPVHGAYRYPKWVCRGCGARWDIDSADEAELNALPCGTRSDR